jgi:predicted kinase
VDATFLKRAQRDAFRAVAARLGVPFAIADVVASAAVLRERVSRRQQGRADASEADLAVLEHQLRSEEPLGPDEQAAVVRFDTEHMTADAIRSRARRLIAPTEEPVEQRR